MILKKKFKFACLNFAAGYYNYHTSAEYVVVSDVENTLKLAKKVVGILGDNFYKFVYKEQSSFDWFD